MKIRHITDRIGNDFWAICECEHCGEAYEARGYDDASYRLNVLPAMKCRKCGQASIAKMEPPQEDDETPARAGEEE